MQIDARKDFGTRECPSCAVDVAKNQNRCPICGYEFPQNTPMSRIKWIAAVLMLLLLVFVFVL